MLPDWLLLQRDDIMQPSVSFPVFRSFGRIYWKKKNLNINKDIGKNSEVYHNKCYNSTPFKKHKTLTDYHKIRQVPKWSYQVVQNLSQVVITVYFSWTFWRNIIPQLSYNWVLHYMYNKQLVITMWLCIPNTYKYYMYTNKETSLIFIQLLYCEKHTWYCMYLNNIGALMCAVSHHALQHRPHPYLLPLLPVIWLGELLQVFCRQLVIQVTSLDTETKTP